MKRQIRTYKELVQYDQDLDVLLDAQKELIKNDFEKLAASIRPTVSALNIFGKIIAPEKDNFWLSFGTGKLIDFIFRWMIPSKAGWLTKLIGSFFLKNYATHYIAESKDKIIEKLNSVFQNKNGIEKKAVTG